MLNATDFLVHAQNHDGGWGYRLNGMSYVEPTAAVLLALTDPTARARGRDLLLALQHADGGWGIAALDAESGWMTALAVRALAEFPEARAVVTRGVQWLLAAEGNRVTEPNARRITQEMYTMDSTLRAWSWQPGDAAWVHPTALAMLALVAAGERDHARVREGVHYLYNRACPEGGWNSGNPWMLDKKIPATVQDTAVALLALRAANVSSDAWQVTKAIEYLQRAVARAQTPAELAWGTYALRDRKVDTSGAIARLNARQSADGGWSGNPFYTATALLALEG